MDELTQWIEGEKEKLANLASSGDAILADKARSKLNLISFMEGVAAKIVSSPEIDVDALLANASVEINTKLQSMFEAFRSDFDGFKAEINSLIASIDERVKALETPKS